MSPCNICGKEHKYLNRLTDMYSREGFAEICNPCLGEMQAAVDQIDKIIEKQVKILRVKWMDKAIERLRSKFKRCEVTK